MNTDLKVGDMILIDYGTDADGRWWWKCDARDVGAGPFPTKSEAQRHAEIAVLGEQCKITSGGQWDPAWDRLQ
jgi:hypothetical protein